MSWSTPRSVRRELRLTQLYRLVCEPVPVQGFHRFVRFRIGWHFNEPKPF